MKYINVKQIAEKAGCTEQHIYYISRMIGRLPTVKEAKEYKGKRGRPPKHFSYEQQQK